jgi:hypothetical protein
MARHGRGLGRFTAATFAGAVVAMVPSAHAADAVCSQPITAADMQGVAQFIWANCPQQLDWPQDAATRMSGPRPADQKASVHGYVRNFYAPSVYEWLKAGRPGKTIPNGALIIKQMYKDVAGKVGDVSGWAVIVKQADASFDGWLWGYVNPKPLVPPKPGDDPLWGGQFFDPNCMACHASASTAESTFASLQNIAPPRTGAGPAAMIADPVRPAATGLLGGSTHARINLPPVNQSSDPKMLIPTQIPPQSASVVRVGPAGATGFATSDACSGCHDASNLAFGVQAHMTSPQNLASTDPKARPLTNFSPFSEWGASLMGLAGRDPVFQAQRESETTLFPELADVISNACYACHGVMGKRQKAIEQPGALFTHADFLSTRGPNARFGALARDGVSCLACHRMTTEGLGTEASFTGRFNLADAKTVFGPYDGVVQYPMQNAIDMTPKPGAAVHESAMCGSCHVVETPILDPGRKYTQQTFESAKKSHEQTTYLEWLNSAFQNETPAQPGATPRTCQNCHMPRDIAGKAITSRIANIEDDTYVGADGKPFPNTAPAKDIALTPRSPFARHTLVGANLFVLEMFRQFGAQLGLPTSDPNYDSNTFSFVPKFVLSTNETTKQVQSATARLSILKQARNANGLEVSVQVENLTGHKFPSGVGFRRAFIEFVALGADGRVLWSSGATNPQGEIVDGAGKVLATEFSKTQWQPHQSVIDSDTAVQIYETRSRDTAGLLTTSFLSLANDVKDNRLTPRGWSGQGPYASWTTPIAVDAALSPGYFNGNGSDALVYRVPAGVAARVARVRATLYYQSIPPYYLRDRFEVGGNGPATSTLKVLVTNVHYEQTPAAGWKLMVGQVDAIAPGGK